MKNFRRTLPPLDYLTFFEAVARNGSFTLAAKELNVSQAAVSKRVKVLEEWVGQPLVNRQGRQITMTQAGRALALDTGEALDYLTSCLQRLNGPGASMGLSLGANVAVAQYWLTPRINEYLLGQNAVPVTTTASDKDADLFALDADALIFYGAEIPTGWDGHVLFEEIWQPLAAPSVVANGWTNAPMLDFDKLTPKWINWADFAEQLGNAALLDGQRANLGSYGSTLDAAIRGRGVALGCADVLGFEVDEQRLIPIAEYQLNTGRSYFLIWRVGTFTDDLKSQLNSVGIIQ